MYINIYILLFHSILLCVDDVCLFQVFTVRNRGWVFASKNIFQSILRNTFQAFAPSAAPALRYSGRCSGRCSLVRTTKV